MSWEKLEWGARDSGLRGDQEVWPRVCDVAAVSTGHKGADWVETLSSLRTPCLWSLAAEGLGGCGLLRLAL